MTGVKDSHQQNSNAMSIVQVCLIIMLGCLDIADDVQQYSEEEIGENNFNDNHGICTAYIIEISQAMHMCTAPFPCVDDSSDDHSTEPKEGNSSSSDGNTIAIPFAFNMLT